MKNEQTASSKKITISLVLSWIFGILFWLTGIVSIFSDPKPGIVMLIMAAVLIPPINKLVNKKWKFHISGGIKITVIVIGFIIFGSTIETPKSIKQENNQTKIQEEQEQLKDEIKPTEEQYETAHNEESVKTETISATNEEKIKIVEEKTEPTNEITIPAEYKSALAKADIYANNQHMSKKGLYGQLTSEYGEQFSKEATQYAVDNVKTDWNINALVKATSYANNQHMSKKGVYEQLISEHGEQFTQTEAQYAVDKVKANWKENALAKAKNYQENQNMSPAAIHDQLTSNYGEKFTESEADYAIENLNN